MEYRFSKDPLFGKYCYIDTPWIAGKNTIYRIVNSGVRSNAWIEVPISGREEVVLHDYQEDVIFVVLDTLISEDSRIKKVALCSGAGGSFAPAAMASGADLYITGEARYHDLFNYDGMIVAVVGHYESEICVMDIFREIIEKACPGVKVQATTVNANPVNYM